MWGAERGGEFAKSLLPEGAGKLARIGAGAAGGAAGGLPGLYLGLATTPGEDFGLSKFRSDPNSALGMLLAQGLTGVGFEAAHALKQAKADKVEQVKHDTASLDDILAPVSDASEYESLQKKPVAARTELDNARMAELQGVLNQHNEFILQDELKRAKTMSFDDFATLPESPTSIRAQIKLLSQGKKPVIEIPKGSEIPGQIPVQWQNYLQHDTADGNTYLYNPDKASPEAIDAAKATNTLGTLLGYGIPAKPANPIGAMVLRSRKGVEKAGVLYDEATKPAVVAALEKMREGDDYIRHEDIQSVLARRVHEKGRLKHFSIANEGVPEQSVNFANSVLDKLEGAFVPKIRGMRTVGPRFQVDQQGNVSGKGVMQAIEQWAPKEMVDHWKEAGIGTLLGADKVSKQALGDWLQKNTPEVEVKYLTPKQGETTSTEGRAAQHRLESRGWKVDSTGKWTSPEGYTYEFDDKNIFSKDGTRLRPDSLDEDLQKVHAEYINEINVGPAGESDAATGRYGVEPVPVHEMDNPVDILVRVPHKQTPVPLAKREWGGHETQLSGVKFRGPHFGDSDVNVVASIRGYFKTLQSGEKAFFPFEVQSDWGQKAAKSGVKSNVVSDQLPAGYRIGPIPDHVKINMGEVPLKKYPNSVSLFRTGSSGQEGHEGVFYSKEEATKAAHRIKNQFAVEGHPLLESYETLALKTAIQHARANGAT
jgi:hypothetical protein